MIEYRRLERDGHCSLCGDPIKKLDKETTIVQFFFRTKSPKVNICRQCAYKIFYAPTLVNEKGEIE